MTPFPLGLNSPGKRLSSTRENRSADRLLAIIAEHHLRGAYGHVLNGKPTGRYTPHDMDGRPGDETTCNVFAQDVSEAMSVMLPRNTRANDLVRWLMLDSKEFDWEGVTPHIAQRMADEGQLALCGWVNPDGGSGHIAVMVPSLGEPGEWIAQSGRSLFTRGTVAQGFGAKPVLFFAHP